MRNVFRLVFCAALLGSPVAVSGQMASDPELTRGIRQVDEGDFTTAIRTLTPVVQRLKEKGGPAEDLARGYLYLGIAQLNLRHDAEARAAFVSAQLTDPRLKLSRSDFPPRVVDTFEQVRPPGPSPSPTSTPVVIKPTAGPPTPVPSKALATVLIEAAKQGDFTAVRQLLKEDPSLINEKDAVFGATSLHWAALRGRQSVAALLIAQGADVNARNKDGETPLQVAERAKQTDIVRLLQSGPKPAPQSGPKPAPPSGTSAAPTGTSAAPAPPAAAGSIWDAAKNNDVERLRKLVGETPTSVSQPDAAFGATPLHWASLKGHAESVKLLLAQGADVNAHNKEGETPLQVAERAKNTAVVQLLKSANAPIAGLVDAVRDGDLPKVQQLLADNRTLINQKDTQFGGTPLHWAALKGNPNIVEYLLSKNADVNALNQNGETALMVAERAKRPAVVALLQPASAPAGGDAAAVIEAAKTGDVASLRRLVAANPKLLTVKDAQFGATPLHWASLRGYADAVELLLAQGADVRARNGAGETPLQVAERAGRADVVRILSKSGS